MSWLGSIPNVSEGDMTDRKQELIEQYRDINTDHDWWDNTYDTFCEDMLAKHIDVDDMCFTGFWSQGDGASFVGVINNNLEFLKAHDLTESYPHVMKLLSYGGEFYMSIERISSRYVHENTVAVELSHTDGFVHVLPTDNDLRAAIVTQWDEALSNEYEHLTEQVTTIIRGYCRDLYHQLQEEYEYLTSDEAVWEAIVANELDEIEEEEV
jgi:hypothetical protein